MSASLPQVLALKALEGALRQALALDPATQARLAAFAGKRLYIETRTPALGLFVWLEADGVHLRTEGDRHPHATIEAPSFELLKMALSDEAHFIGGPVQVAGDVVLVQELHAIARDLDIDWETGLARLLGNNLSYPVSRGLRGLFGFAERTARVFLRNTGEYLREEKELVPVRWEVDEYLNDNQDLRADIERVEARLARMKKRVAKLEEDGTA
ncbi:MAG: SCP2 domain-containing protein [Moraxellaceae bacterium]